VLKWLTSQQLLEPAVSATPKQPYADFNLASGLRLGIGVVLPVFPYLVPADWPDAAEVVHRRVLSDPLTPQIPLMTFAYLTDELRTFVTRERFSRMGRTLDHLRAESLANLQKRPASWHLRELIVETGDILVYAVCEDDMLAAERILDKSFLILATHLLGMPSQAAVAVPRRGQILAVGLNNSDAALRCFKRQVQQWHAESKEEGIAPLLFRMIFGTPMGVIRFDGWPNLPVDDIQID
jgi:hypothetical protein